jgi:hypothetical protein
VSALAGSLQAWFTDRLIRKRNASPHTIASYRDTIRLLLTYASQRLDVEPSRLDLNQLDAPLIGAFLHHLATDRGCGARTRSTRMAAIRTFYRYCLVRHPEHAATIERVLQIGPKRHERALVTYLTEPELDALIDAPRPLKLDRPPRPRDHHPARPDRASGVRADPPSLRRHPPRNRRARDYDGQGPQAADHPADEGDGGSPPRVARRTRQPPSDSWTDYEHVVSSLCFPRTAQLASRGRAGCGCGEYEVTAKRQRDTCIVGIAVLRADAVEARI